MFLRKYKNRHKRSLILLRHYEKTNQEILLQYLPNKAALVILRSPPFAHFITKPGILLQVSTRIISFYIQTDLYKPDN
jgi:hypothetical protein